MSGLFLNFYHVQFAEPKDGVPVNYISYDPYASKEAYLELKQRFPHLMFYRADDKLYFWNINDGTEIPANSRIEHVFLNKSPKLFSRMFEQGAVRCFQNKLASFKVSLNNHSHVWQIVSSKDLLNSSIDGLVVQRVVDFSPSFFFKDQTLFFGFSLSTSLRNSFTWSKSEFTQHGIDTIGLKGDDQKIFANTQSISRFLESRGATDVYNNIIDSENQGTKQFSTIDNFFQWIERNKQEISLPANLKVESIAKKYLPLDNNVVKSEIIYKPERYFYSNRRNAKRLSYYDQMVKEYQPYSLELYQNKHINMRIICPLEYQGETEGFIRKIEAKLKEVFHFNQLNFIFKTINGRELNNYKEVLYDAELLKCDLIYVIVNEAQEKLPPHYSPYYFCKAKFIGNGIPTQDVQIETIRQSLNAFTMTNIALNTYAKLGGTAWTIEKEDKLRDELVIGIGSTMSDNNQYVLGIAQVFHNDGRYLTGDCSPLSTFENYASNLEEHLYKALKPLVEQMGKSGTFRLIFHLFKSASEKYEISAINGLKERFKNFNFEFALVHLAYGHNYRLYYNDGKYDVNQGTYIQMTHHTALLHFVSKSDLPLKIDLDKRSTFTSLFYLAKQVYWFSHLSHRSYIPSKRTVTIMYPSLMAKMTEELKKVEGWDYDRLKAVSDKLWFI